MSNTAAVRFPVGELNLSEWAKDLASLGNIMAEECGIQPLPQSLLDHITQKATHLEQNREISH